MLKPATLTSALDFSPLRVSTALHKSEDIEFPWHPPHAVFATVFEKHPEYFVHNWLGGDRNNLQRFWADMRGHPSMQDNPVLQRSNFEAMAVPLDLHFDTVPVTRVTRKGGDGAMVWSFRSVLSVGSTLTCRQLIAILYKSLLWKRGPPDMHTRATFYKYLAWSLFWLYEGVWPTRDVDDNQIDGGGTPLAAGMFGLLFLICADTEALEQELGLNNHASLEPCALCNCNCSTIPWTDFRVGARWMQTIWTARRWIARTEHKHVLLQLPGVTVTTVHPDTMHIKHLGTDQYLYASTIKLLVHHIMPGRPEENLEVFQADLKDAYSASGTSNAFSNILESMYNQGNDTLPCLSGKAAECRHLGFALKLVFEKHMNRKEVVHRNVLRALRASVKLETLIDEHREEYKWPAAAADKFLETTIDLLALCTWLAQHHQRQRPPIVLFHITIKFHYLLHVALVTKFINPRLSWNYAGEDFMRIVKKLLVSCQSGTPARLIARKALRKYAHGMTSLLDDCVWR